MARLSGFDNSFGNAFGGVGRTGELQIFVTNDNNPITSYQDGDILFAYNSLYIRSSWAEQLTIPSGFNIDGLRDVNSVSRLAWFENIYQFRFERLNSTQIRKINLTTLDEEIITTGVPDSEGNTMFVDEYIRRRKKHISHNIFGFDGSEIYYGGRSNINEANIDLVWENIESLTSHKEIDYHSINHREHTLKNSLIISVNDFSNIVRETLTESESDIDGVMVKKRKQNIDWRELPYSVSQRNDILNKSLIVDLRSDRKHLYNNYLVLK